MPKIYIYWHKCSCHACDGHTHTHVKVEQYSAEAESAITQFNAIFFISFTCRNVPAYLDVFVYPYDDDDDDNDQLS